MTEQWPTHPPAQACSLSCRQSVSKPPPSLSPPLSSAIPGCRPVSSQALAPDTIPGVRLALSSACLDLAPKLGQDVFVRQLLPLLEKVLSDTTTPDVKVRLNVLQVRDNTHHHHHHEQHKALEPSRTAPPWPHLAERRRRRRTSSSRQSADAGCRREVDVGPELMLIVVPACGLLVPQRLEVIGTWLPSLVDSLLPIILLLRDDDNWRIRKAVLEVLPVLAAHLGMEYFETRLLERYFSAFKDRICEVRLAATGSLAALAKVAGGDWVLAHVMPRLKTLYQESSFYLIRVAVLNSLRVGEEEPMPACLPAGSNDDTAVSHAWLARMARGLRELTSHDDGCLAVHHRSEPGGGGLTRTAVARDPEPAAHGQPGPHPQRALHGRTGARRAGQADGRCHSPHTNQVREQHPCHAT